MLRNPTEHKALLTKKLVTAHTLNWENFKLCIESLENTNHGVLIAILDLLDTILYSNKDQLLQVEEVLLEKIEEL